MAGTDVLLAHPLRKTLLHQIILLRAEKLEFQSELCTRLNLVTAAASLARAATLGHLARESLQHRRRVLVLGSANAKVVRGCERLSHQPKAA